MLIKDFKDLKVWVKAHELTLATYRATRLFPREETYGLVSQLRRAASSIAGNIAEGCGRRSDREFVRFLQIARGSASELEYHILLARDLEYMQPADFAGLQSRLVELQRMLTALVRTVRSENSEEPGNKLGTTDILHRTEVQQNSRS